MIYDIYPIKFKNLYYEKIWGGRKLEDYRKNLPKGHIGESWDLACHKHGMSIVSNGAYKGMSLLELVKLTDDKIVGELITKKDFLPRDFPLLLKLINSKENLSLQVHPDSEYARKVEGDNGKVEAWYIIDAEEDAELIVGTKNCTQEEFVTSCKNGNVEAYMNKIKVQSGDMFFIEAGLVHAIGKGILLVEVQQNSDTTYRVYDYNRGRELHIKKALDVIDITLQPKRIHGEENLELSCEGEKETKVFNCIKSDVLNLQLYKIKDELKECSDKKKFYIFTCVDGKGKIIFSDENNITREESIEKCESILIPAALGEYRLQGNMKLLKSYI